MSKKGITGALLGAALSAGASDASTCGYRAWDPNTGQDEYVPYYKCINNGDHHITKPAKPSHPPHTPPTPHSAGGGGHHHHPHGTPTPQPNPNRSEEKQPDYLKKFNEELHGKDNSPERKQYEERKYYQENPEK
jgi:hypothetical protein